MTKAEVEPARQRDSCAVASTIPRSGRTAQVRHEEAVVHIYDEPALGWTLVLRRQPVHLVDGYPEGGYTDAYELICCDCGDNPDLDYRDISLDLQRIRGPYRFSAGIEAYRQHDRLRHERQPVPAENGTRRRTGHADGETE
jgi:hypothetical protein